MICAEVQIMNTGVYIPMADTYIHKDNRFIPINLSWTMGQIVGLFNHDIIPSQ